MFVAFNSRHFKFGMPIDNSNFQPMENKLSLKLAWSRYVIHFNDLNIPQE